MQYLGVELQCLLSVVFIIYQSEVSASGLNNISIVGS